MTRASVSRQASNYLLHIFIPISIWLYLAHFNPISVFITAILAVILLNSLIAKSTQQLTMKTSTILGSLIHSL